ncbi:MAG: DeoR/GlpR transcriptional regulator [Lachnospiraceae bacterium]|nr:DeoR/GlpR transcriptional regulator [Lachnospiraceae bacterium]
MLAKERHDSICELLKQNGAVTTAELVDRFGVSVETIRRDLLVLEQNQKLQRVHGGAVALEEMKPFMELSYRFNENDEQKKELARTAASFVRDGDVIGMDSGSTAVFLAEAFKERLSRLTVVTHSLDVFEILNSYKEFEVILCGGHFLRQENAFYGPVVINTLQQLHVQKVFIFPSAVSLQFGICDRQTQLFMVQQQLLHCGDSVYILADSSKFERKELLKLSEMQTNFTYITDSNIKPGLLKAYAEQNLKIITERTKEK